MLKYGLAFVAAMTATSVAANQTSIVGTVQSKCSIYTDVSGVYGAPLPSRLSTAPADGGVIPVIRFDVSEAGYYKAVIAHPNDFSSAPALDDAVNWTGDTVVAQVSDPLMSGIETSKVQYNNVSEFDLTVAGTVWFETTSTADYGFNKSFPAGSYTAIVEAECIAK